MIFQKKAWKKYYSNFFQAIISSSNKGYFPIFNVNNNIINLQSLLIFSKETKQKYGNGTTMNAGNTMIWIKDHGQETMFVC